MAQFHFVEDYVKQVAAMKEKYPLDEAMAMAVGNADYYKTGQTERDILFAAGLQPGMSVFDLGCGSGRLGHCAGKGANYAALSRD
jgi:ribosomal protein L11 methylase PrmA